MDGLNKQETISPRKILPAFPGFPRNICEQMLDTFRNFFQKEYDLSKWHAKKKKDFP